MKKPENTGEIQARRDENGRFIKGASGNLAGKPAGTKNFETLFDEAVKKVAKTKKLSSGDIEVEIIAKAIVEALKGNYAYYKDLIDRLFGKAKESIDLNHSPKIEISWEPTEEERKKAEKALEDLDE